MFERYTERARRVLFFARYEASQLGSISIETEHLLLGLIREGKGLTSRIFARSHLSLENIRKEIEGRTVFREKVSTSVEIPFSAVENAEMPMRIARLPLAEARPRAQGLLTRVGLGERLVHRPGMLSGGEQQRVAVARALVMRPSLLLADEPTGDLDEQTAGSLHALLREMHQTFHLTSIIATHNTRLAAGCDRVLRLEGGRLVAA